MTRFVMGLVLAALPSALQAHDLPYRHDHAPVPQVEQPGPTPWSNGSPDATTYRDPASGRITGYGSRSASGETVRDEHGRFLRLLPEGLGAVAPNRQEPER